MQVKDCQLLGVAGKRSIEDCLMNTGIDIRKITYSNESVNYNMTGNNYPPSIFSSDGYKIVDHTKTYNKIINSNRNNLFKSGLVKSCHIIDLKKINPYVRNDNEIYNVKYFQNKLNDFDKFTQCINNLHNPETLVRITFVRDKMPRIFNIFNRFPNHDYEKSNIYIITNPDNTSTIKYVDEYKYDSTL